VESKGRLIRDGLKGFTVRGRGLMLGIEVGSDPKQFIPKLLERGLIALTAGQDAVRLLPPLTVSRGELEEGLEILREVLS
jgi:acetylornithine/succinyldiaminopimelate/putrescine aminotransferase